jgi:hypothetical protein
VGLLAYINLALAVFNMLPGLPLDGGNVLKAIVWKLTGNRHSGIRWASRAGQVIGWSAVAIGGFSVLGLSNIGSFWTLLIGWFLLQNAGRSAQFANVEEALSGLTAADAVLDSSPVIEESATLRQLADTAIMLSGSGWQRFLVQDIEGQLLGTVHLDTLKKVPTDQWSSAFVRDWIQPIPEDTIIAADQPLIEVIGTFQKQGVPALAVTRANGTLIGLLEKAEIISLLQQKGQMQLA